MKNPIIPSCLLLLSVLCVFFFAGCATFSRAEPLPEIQIEAKADGSQFEVEGKVVLRSRLASALRAAGAGPQTEISILIPSGVTTSLMAQVTADLRKAGFRKILFARPRHISIQTSDSAASVKE